MTALSVEDHARDMALRLFKAARTLGDDPAAWKRFNSYMRNLGYTDPELWMDVVYHLSWEIDGDGWTTEGEIVHKSE